MTKRSTIMAAAVLAFAFAGAAPVFAEDVYAGPIMVAADHSMSVQSMLGKPVFNEQHEKIGTIQNVMVKASAAEPTAILSVGDYLGTGPKLVAVPLDHLHMASGNAAMTMAATKSSLEKLPTYNYGA